MTPLAMLLVLAAAPAQSAAQAPRPVVTLASATARAEIIALERVSLDPRRDDTAPLLRQVDVRRRTVEFF